MTPRQRTTVFATACLILSMAGNLIALRALEKSRPRANIQDVLYISSPKFVKRASLGFDGLMACIYWTRAVQYFGNRHQQQSGSYNELAPLLKITTALDPHLIAAYEFGASFLAPAPPAGAGEPAKAIELMEFGIQQNPDNWRLYYDLAFVYYTELKDYKKAGEAFERASRVPNAHPLMKLLAAQMHEHAGDFATARMLWQATYESSNQTDIKKNAIEHLRSIRVDEDVTNLQAAVTRFGKRTGRPPTSMWELIAAEGLAGIPVDPDGKPYIMTVDGRIQVQDPENFPFIERGLPAGYKRNGLPKPSHE